MLVLLCVWVYNSITIQHRMNSRAMAKLNQEISFFKSNTTFTLHFRPNQLLDLYECAAETGRPDSRRLTARIDKEMSASCGRSVYISMKWLGFHHKLLQETDQSTTIQRSAQSLSKLAPIGDKRHYEEYIQTRLVTPYRQYLLKLAQIQLNKAVQSSSPREDETQSVYCMYNLAVFAMQQLSGAMRDFSNYFLRFYPCLNEYTGKVGKDLQRFMRQIRLRYQRGELPRVAFLEVEQLEGGLAFFDHSAQKYTNNWIFPQTNAKSLELQVETRTQGNILQPIHTATNYSMHSTPLTDSI